MITMRCLGVSFVFLIILARAVAFIFFYDLPTKLEDYSKAVGRMGERAVRWDEERSETPGE